MDSRGGKQFEMVMRRGHGIIFVSKSGKFALWKQRKATKYEGGDVAEQFEHCGRILPSSQEIRAEPEIGIKCRSLVKTLTLRILSCSCLSKIAEVQYQYGLIRGMDSCLVLWRTIRTL